MPHHVGLRMSMQQENGRTFTCVAQVDDGFGCFDPAVREVLEHGRSVLHFRILFQCDECRRRRLLAHGANQDPLSPATMFVLPGAALAVIDMNDAVPIHLEPSDI